MIQFGHHMNKGLFDDDISLFVLNLSWKKSNVLSVGLKKILNLLSPKQ